MLVCVCMGGCVYVLVFTSVCLYMYTCLCGDSMLCVLPSYPQPMSVYCSGENQGGEGSTPHPRQLCRLPVHHVGLPRADRGATCGS